MQEHEEEKNQFFSIYNQVNNNKSEIEKEIERLQNQDLPQQYLQNLSNVAPLKYIDQIMTGIKETQLPKSEQKKYLKQLQILKQKQKIQIPPEDYQLNDEQLANILLPESKLDKQIRKYNEQNSNWILNYNIPSDPLISFDFLRKQCQQCKYYLAKAHRLCTRHTCFTNYCWQHQRQVWGVQVKKSNIKGAGMGLFNQVPRKKGDILPFSYEGQILTQRQLDQKYTKDELAPYTIQLQGTDEYIEPINKNSPAVFMNDNRGGQNNVKYMNDVIKKNGYGRISLKVITDIPKGQEMYGSYGSNYW